MAQLDKTFPTNDCSMCILSPKFIECAENPNISIMTNTKVERVEGEAGNFQVHLIEEPRYVDEEKCTGCGTCAEPADLCSRYLQREPREESVSIFISPGSSGCFHC